MTNFEVFLNQKLEEQKNNGLHRQLQNAPLGIDFCTNDYLGIIKNNKIEYWLNENLPNHKGHGNGASRLLGGNSELYTECEKKIADFHDAEAALLFSNGYMANYALISTIAKKDDVILYDHLIHASLRAGIKGSLANSYSFKHNDVQDATKKLEQINVIGNIFIVTETVFSMDGDMANLSALVNFANSCKGILIVDEAHAFGVFGNKGEGLIQQQNLQHQIPIRIYTYGKAAGVHGAAIVASQVIINYLINFCKPLIYSTAMANSQVAAIYAAYHLMPFCNAERQQLQANIKFYNQLFKKGTNTAIQQILVPGNEAVVQKADELKAQNIGVLPVRYPTVAKGTERIRVVLHSYNTEEEIAKLFATK